MLEAIQMHARKEFLDAKAVLETMVIPQIEEKIPFVDRILLEARDLT